MNHEPECTVTYFPCDCCEKTPCACEQIRSAYQRGRDDAAKAVRGLHTKEYYVTPGCSDGCCGDGWEGYQCTICCEDYPCDTIRALDGEQE